METSHGESLVDMYYDHSLEVIHHMIMDPELRAMAVDAIVSIQPVIQDMVEGDGEMVVSMEQIGAVMDFVDHLEGIAGADLLNDLQKELNRFGVAEDLAGHTSGEIQQMTLGVPLKITNPGITAGGAIEFTITGELTGTVQVEFSEDLNEWFTLQIDPITELPFILTDDQHSDADQIYYRVIINPATE